MTVSITPKTAAKYLVGRTVVSVDVKKVADDNRSSWSFESITFDDGSLICFNVEETDFDEYVISASRLPKGTVPVETNCIELHIKDIDPTYCRPTFDHKSVGEIRSEIFEGMARAFFVSAWSQWAVEYGPGLIGNGVSAMDDAPKDIDLAAYDMAHDFINDLESLHGKSIVQIFKYALKLADTGPERRKTPETFGQFAAFAKNGHGIGLDDEFGTDSEDFVNVYATTDISFSCFDLNSELYPIPEEIRESK